MFLFFPFLTIIVCVFSKIIGSALFHIFAFPRIFGILHNSPENSGRRTPYTGHASLDQRLGEFFSYVFTKSA